MDPLTMTKDEESGHRLTVDTLGLDAEPVYLHEAAEAFEREVDATRAALAQAERSNEVAAEQWAGQFCALSDRLAASLARERETREALRECGECDVVTAPPGPNDYMHDPKCLKCAALALAPDSDEPLRMLMQKAADHAFDIHRNDGVGQCEAVDLAIARLLPPKAAGDERSGDATSVE